MLSYLAIIDYCNNARDEYNEGWHVFEYGDGGDLRVLIDDEAIAYELTTYHGEIVASGELRSVKQLRELHNDGWKLIKDFIAEKDDQLVA